MAVTRYHRYIGELWEDLNLEDLVGELSDFLMQSGFGEEPGEWNEDSLQALHDAILEALMRRGLLSEKIAAGQLEEIVETKALIAEVRERTMRTKCRPHQPVYADRAEHDRRRVRQRDAGDGRELLPALDDPGRGVALQQEVGPAFVVATSVSGMLLNGSFVVLAVRGQESMPGSLGMVSGLMLGLSIGL